jgi:protein-L-isoaspartate(D-aspartate) O-methyltransferase
MLDFSPVSTLPADRRKTMVDCQLRTFEVTDPAVLDAFLATPRECFLASSDLALAYSDAQQVVASGDVRRAMLTPMVLARLLQGAEVDKGCRVLDVGGGSGYSAAVLARLAGSVVALESVAGFSSAAAANAAQLGLETIHVVTGPLSAGAAADAPFDVILVNGAVEEGLEALFDELAPGGRLVCVTRAPGQVGRSGKATRFDKIGSDVSSRYLFDAAAPVLAGFERKPQFVF